MDARDSRVVVAASSAGVTASWGVIGVALAVLSGWHVVGGGLSQVSREMELFVWRDTLSPLVDFKIKSSVYLDFFPFQSSMIARIIEGKEGPTQAKHSPTSRLSNHQQLGVNCRVALPQTQTLLTRE